MMFTKLKSLINQVNTEDSISFPKRLPVQEVLTLKVLYKLGKDLVFT